MSVELNKSSMQRIYDEIFSQGNFEAITEVMSPNFVDHDSSNPTGDLEGAKQFVTMVRAAFPDFKMTVTDMLAEGDKVAARYTVTGTHQGEFIGIPATGKTVSATGMDIIQFADGKGIEHWGEFDMVSLLQQLGVIPAMG